MQNLLLTCGDIIILHLSIICYSGYKPIKPENKTDDTASHPDEISNGEKILTTGMDVTYQNPG